MFVPMPIKTNEPTKITANAMAPNRVQKVILSRSSIMLGSLLRVSWSPARLIVYQFPGSHVDRPGVPGVLSCPRSTRGGRDLCARPPLVVLALGGQDPSGACLAMFG